MRRVDYAGAIEGGEQALADLLPNATYVDLPGDGLFPWASESRETLEAIREFLGDTAVEAEPPEPIEQGRVGGLQTILFTDITGSTSMQQRRGDAPYQEALRAHDRSVRTAVREFGGREIKHTGDGIMAAFASAVRAVEAARAIQRRLAEHGRERPDEALLVRIGINAGEPIAEGDDLFGIAVTLASRIGDAAQPGQVLVSEVVRQLSAGKGFDFQSAGERRLKGFDEPMHLYALDSPEPSPVRGVSTLPTFATTFVGRERELAELEELCASAAARLLTVVGPGGMGKTRLAVEAARSLVTKMRDGVAFVPLQSVSDVAAVPLAIAKAVDFAAGGAGDPTEQLAEFLSDREILLVLDNFEQVVAAAPTVAAILEAAPRVRCLVTSREVLNLREEWLFPLEGMRLPASDSAEELQASPAVRLFVERAQQVRHDFDAEADAESVRRICQLVEGLPLGIELAASWTRYMETSAIVEEIERSMDFLESTLRNVPERHRQIRAVFDHSWELLAEPEQQAFARLSVMRGGFTRAAAREVASASMPVLASLVDKSLVRQRADGRYDIHELLRQFAEQRLADAEDESAATQERHARHFIEYLADHRESISGSGQITSTAEVGADLDNIRAAWIYAADHGLLARAPEAAGALFRYYQHRARYVEAVSFYRDIIARLEAREDAADDEWSATQFAMLVGLGWLLIRLGQLDEAAELAYRGIEVAGEDLVGCIDGLGTDPHTLLGIQAMTRGSFDEAEEHGELARARAAERGDRLNLSISYYVLENVAFARGEYERAEELASKGLAIAEAGGDRWFGAYLHNDLGALARVRGALDRSREHLEASYALRRDFDDAQGMAVALGGLAETALEQGRLPDAERALRESLTLYGDLGDRGGRATAQFGLGRVAVQRGELSIAQERFLQALDIAAEMRFVPLIFDTLCGVAELLVEADQRAAAVELLAFIQAAPNALQTVKERAQAHMEGASEGLDSAIVARALRDAGSRDLDEVLDAVRQALHGSRETASTDLFGADYTPLVEELTPRELEVLQLVATGRTNPEIAKRLEISVGTAKWYTSQIYGKLEVQNRTQAVARARELGILP
jgi:predicted ATPase/class 3 adenylate cyclase/DNA-binding NarL/FixJ family response regulator